MAQSQGLLDMMGQGQSGFANWLNPRRNFLQGAFAGMVGQDSLRDGLRGITQGAMAGQQADTAYNQMMEERQAEQDRVNQTAQWIQEMAQQNAGDPRWSALAQGVQTGGIQPGEAWASALQLMQPQGGGMENLTADQRNFMMAQENPEFADFLGAGQQNLPADVQEYNWYADQEQAAGRDPLTYLDFANAMRGNGVSFVTNPDGTTSVQVGGSGRPLTEQQSRDAVYATRAAGALPILDQYDVELANPVARAVEGDPTGVARGALQSPEFQMANNAGLEFLQAILRKDTGAAITAQEQAEYGRVYLPMPGDSQEVLLQKRQARARALAALQAGMAPQAILNMETALQQSGGAAPAGGTAAPSQNVTPNGVTWSF